MRKKHIESDATTIVNIELSNAAQAYEPNQRVDFLADLVETINSFNRQYELNGMWIDSAKSIGLGGSDCLDILVRLSGDSID